jgi:hypothetical protein
MSDLKVLTDAVLVDASGEHAADDWRREDGKLAKQVVGELVAAVARRVTSGIAGGGNALRAPR